MRTKKNRSKKQETRGKIFFFLLFSFFFSFSANAQCAMCRASLESEGNKARVEAVNDGIVFLMAVPYIIVAVAAYAIYRMYRNSVSKEKSETN
jgi:hypothetical protein